MTFVTPKLGSCCIQCLFIQKHQQTTLNSRFNVLSFEATKFKNKKYYEVSEKNSAGVWQKSNGITLNKLQHRRGKINEHIRNNGIHIPDSITYIGECASTICQQCASIPSLIFLSYFKFV